MKKARTALVTALTVFLLSGCGNYGGASKFSLEQSSVFVTREGGLSSAMVETCDKDYYDGQELQAFIEEAVAVYNAANQDGAVALESCTMEEGKAVAVFDYADGTALLNFLKEHGDSSLQLTNLEVMTVSDGLVAGKVSDGTWIQAKDGSGVSLDTVTKKGNLNLVAVEGTGVIQTEGKIQYYSGNVTLQDGFTAAVSEGKAYIVFK
ncbi:MAG: hypothetical protein ACLT46_06735 [Hungatella sp.]